MKCYWCIAFTNYIVAILNIIIWQAVSHQSISIIIHVTSIQYCLLTSNNDDILCLVYLNCSPQVDCYVLLIVYLSVLNHWLSLRCQLYFWQGWLLMGMFLQLYQWNCDSNWNVTIAIFNFLLLFVGSWLFDHEWQLIVGPPDLRNTHLVG